MGARPALALTIDKTTILRMALSQLAMTTDTGAERALIAGMLADLEKRPAVAIALLPVRLPVEVPDVLSGIDGAVVELYVREGIVYAELRIPAPCAPRE